MGSHCLERLPAASEIHKRQPNTNPKRRMHLRCGEDVTGLGEEADVGGQAGRRQGPPPTAGWTTARWQLIMPRCRCSFPQPPALRVSPGYPCTRVKIQYITGAHRPGLPGPRQPRSCLPSSFPSYGQTSLVSQLPLPLALCASLCVKTLPLSAHLTFGACEEHRPEDLSICHWSPQSP